MNRANLTMTNLTMDWTDTGAVVSYESGRMLDIRCPRCNVKVASGVEHRCGDMLPTPDSREAAGNAGKTRRATNKRVKK